MATFTGAARQALKVVRFCQESGIEWMKWCQASGDCVGVVIGNSANAWMLAQEMMKAGVEITPPEAGNTGLGLVLYWPRLRITKDLEAMIAKWGRDGWPTHLDGA
jgi:hypothetical protein